MIELEARTRDEATARRVYWRQALPTGQTVSVGRRPKSAEDQPEWNRADWVINDPKISGCHLYVREDNGVLSVQRRTEPRTNPTVNPVLDPNKRILDAFQVRPGESFFAGDTVFVVHGVPDPSRDESQSDPSFAYVENKAELRKASYGNPQGQLDALSQLPEMIRHSDDPEQLESRMLDILLQAMPLADQAAIVQLDISAADPEPTVLRFKQPGRLMGKPRISNRLVVQSLMQRFESVLYVWDRNLESTMSPIGWAICAPVPQQESPAMALYISGQNPMRVASQADMTRDVELRDYRKFADLAAEIFGSTRYLRHMEAQLQQYRRFMPERMVRLMSMGNAEEHLKAQVTDVTVIFCDLRGSCRAAEQGNDDLMQSWARINSALEIMSSAITQNEGVIGDLQGDAVMGFWGWPRVQVQSVTTQAELAVRAGMRIRAEFKRLRERDPGAFQCGIGIAHGKAVAGKLGVSDQFKIDVFGPVVNLASRLESMTKHFGASILVDEPIAREIERFDPVSRPPTRVLGKFAPKGMDAGMTLTEILPVVTDTGYGGQTLKRLWNSALQAITDGNWGEARSRLFQYLTALKGREDLAAQFLLSFIGDRTQAPADWSGVIPMNLK